MKFLKQFWKIQLRKVSHQVTGMLSISNMLCLIKYINDYNFLMSITSRENKRSRASRVKGEIQLPKIMKGVQHQGSFLQRYEWITRNTEYLLLSTPAVQEEYLYLTNELNSLNSQYIDLLKSFNTSIPKPLRKSRQINASRDNEIRDRQIDNNDHLINKLRAESQLLNKRVFSVQNGKSQHDITIIDIKEKIMKAKQRIKELKLKSREMGENIESGQDIYADLKKLEQQVEGNEMKKLKLQEKVRVSANNLKNLQEKLDQISVQSSYAQSWLNQYYTSEKVNFQEKNMEQLFKQRSYQHQISKKMTESSKNTKQQKYLQSLKSLQEQIDKIKSLDLKLEKTEMRILYKKKEVITLEELFSQSNRILKSRSRTTQKTEANHIENDIIIESEELRDFNKNQLKIINNQRPSGSTEKIDQRKFYLSRLRPSVTKSDLSDFAIRLNNQKNQLKNQLYSNIGNKTEVLDTKPLQFQVQDLKSLTSSIQNQNNRYLFRTSRSKLRDDLKQAVTASKQISNIACQEIIQESNEHSPAKIQQQQPIVEEKKQNEQIAEQVEEIPEVVKPSEDESKTNAQEEEIRRKKDLINNYIDRFEEQGDEEDH